MSVKPMTVANPSFTLDAKARDCPPLQFVREFTVNGVEAIAERREMKLSNPGTDFVVWRRFSELGSRVKAPKLCCIDTGTGMIPDEMEMYINSLASTSKEQALHANYGMGAKIAGAPGNPAGLTYLSWTGSPDQGYTCTLTRDPETQQWGLQEDPATLAIVAPADPGLCPSEIRQAGWRGTVVVFHGKNAKQDTTLPPVDDLGVDWLLKTLNMRFLELPRGVQVRCQPPGESFERRALGQLPLLEKHTVDKGAVRLSDATVHWRILDDDHERRRKQNARWMATGHRAAIYKDELYELRSASAGGYRKLQEFGIVLGYERVVLYVEPDLALPDTVRAHLVVEGDAEGKDLPWERWADEFAPVMPKSLRDLVEQSAGKQANRDRRDIMRRLEEIAKDMPIPRYEANDKGSLKGATPTHGGRSGTGSGKGGPGKSGSNPGSAQGGDVVSLFTRPDGHPVEKSEKTRIPEIKPDWVSVAAGTRTPPVLEDRAATFLQRQGVVQLSEDFRGFSVLLSYFKSRYGKRSGVGPVVVAEVKSAYEDQVIEYIVGILRLRSQPHWTAQDEEVALDDRALTGALMQYATLAAKIDERLARRLRKAA